MNPLSLSIAFIIDLIFGDPYWFPHPIKLIGHFIYYAEKFIRRYFISNRALKFAGIILVLSTVGFGVVITAVPLWILLKFNPMAYAVGIVFFSYTAISTRCLAYESSMVKKELSISLEKGRKRVSYIVGRDTTNLSEEEVIKATIETVAENTTDGIIAPIIYLFIGGPVLAMIYKCVSTLDSMVGYKNEKYLHLGWASAKLDDVLNYIPARLAGFLMVIASFLMKYDYKKSLEILLRDHDNHQSPNSAWTESAAAGALNIQLGGTHEYFGKLVYKPTIGDEIRKSELNDISRMNKLMITTACIFVFLLCVIGIVVQYI